MVYVAYNFEGKNRKYVQDIEEARKSAIKYLARHKGKGYVVFFKTKTTKNYFAYVDWTGYPEKDDLMWVRCYDCDIDKPWQGSSEAQWLNVNGKLN